MSLYSNLRNSFFLLSVAAFIGFGCEGDTAKTEDQENNASEAVNLEEDQLLKMGGKLFSIPSPIQTASLIKDANATYNKDILNTPSKVNNYSTNFKKAVNLGVYGADLGYVTLYDQTQDAISYLTAIKSIADDIGVSSAFDVGLVQRFEQNMGNKDSLLSLVSEAYKSSDRYLKNNEQNDIGAVILAGGWIESLYFATTTASKTKNKDIVKRVGEQKTALNNLLRLLSPYRDSANIDALVVELLELNDLYNKVNTVYTYEEPTTDEANKITTINSTSSVSVSDEQLEVISEKIMKIRTDIIS